MQISGLDHVEFYVGDVHQSAFYLTTAFGFRLVGHAGPETGLTGERSLLLAQGDIRLMLTSGLAPGHRATEYVRVHGDGVAVLALGVPDAQAAYEAAVSRGALSIEQPRVYERGDARVVTAAVNAFGDVVHRFVERHGPQEEFLPGAMLMSPADPAAQEADLLRLLDHVAVCLPAGELATTVRFYQDVFGFEQIFQEFIEVGEQAMDSKVVRSATGDVTLTLIEPVLSRKPGQIDDFLSRHGGAGVQHLAFLTGDIVEAVGSLEQRGVRFLHTPDSYYEELGRRVGIADPVVEALREVRVLVDRDHWGKVFQIFTQAIYARHTFFVEVISRDGARTFGSGNIKALYEAVEREKVAV
jgi:4-hydroxymandelate synthase